MKDSKEEKAKEYAEGFSIKRIDPASPSYASITRKENIERHFKAGFEAGRQEERKEIVQLLKNAEAQFKITGFVKEAFVANLLFGLIENPLSTELENLSK